MTEGAPVRYWTVDEAKAYLPRLRLLVEVIRRASHLAVNAKGNGHASLPGSKRTGTPSSTLPQHVTPSTPGTPGATDDSPDVPVAFDVEHAIAEIEEHGIVLRDAERGLIDFPARHSGRDVLLCWQLGEDDLDWWHLPEDGFAGRRRLPLPPEI
jgi:hypothetical protein